MLPQFWNHVSIARRLQVTGAAIILLLSVLLITGGLTIRDVRHQQDIALHLQQGATHLQLMLRGVNESAVTAGASASVKAGRAGIERFNEVYGQLLLLTVKSPEIHNFITGEWRKSWESLRPRVERFLDNSESVDFNDVPQMIEIGKLMAAVYITCGVFVFVVLGGIAAATGFSLLKFLKYIGEEILIVLGTSSSESALPRLMAKLEYLGCAKPVVGLVVPTGYSFNLDGTSIYMTMAAVFVAQASGVDLSLGQEIGMLGVLLITSKGAAAVTGSGFVTLAATLAAFPAIPVAGLTLLLGVDRFMSEARSITNLIGNAVATMVVAKWDGVLDLERARLILDGGVPAEVVVEVVAVEYVERR